jgi:alanine racemase
VLECQTVPRGEIVGYAGTFRTDRESRLAVLGIGYANGFPWSAANRIALDIRGYRAPIVGRVSMEYTTIDVTDVPLGLCHRGTWLDLLHDHIDADWLGDAVGVNGQEILTRLGKGCHRDYHRAGAARGDGNDGPA